MSKTESWGTGFVFGMFVGAFITLCACLITMPNWHQRLINDGLAHYDQHTGEWVLDAEETP